MGPTLWQCCLLNCAVIDHNHLWTCACSSSIKSIRREDFLHRFYSLYNGWLTFIRNHDHSQRDTGAGVSCGEHEQRCIEPVHWRGWIAEEHFSSLAYMAVCPGHEWGTDCQYKWFSALSSFLCFLAGGGCVSGSSVCSFSGASYNCRNAFPPAVLSVALKWSTFSWSFSNRSFPSSFP